MPRTCVNIANSFWNVCGELTFTSQKCNLNPIMQKAWEFHFEKKIARDQNNICAPHIFCKTSLTLLACWLKHEAPKMRFSLPVVRIDPKYHLMNCYFSPTNVADIKPKSKHSVNYLNFPHLCDISHEWKHSFLHSLISSLSAMLYHTCTPERWNPPYWA